MPWFVVPLLVAVVVTAALLPAVRALLCSHDVLDVPGARSSHTASVPRGGGIACLGGVAAGLLAAQLHGQHLGVWPAVAAVGALALLGFGDDVRTLPALPRLIGQLVAGGVCGWFVGHDVAAIAIGVVVVAVAVNAVNFMDGINGISGLTMVVWGATAIVVGERDDLVALSVVGAVCAGAAIAFLPANVPAARLFLGDVGSYLFGGLVAVGILLGIRHGGASSEVLAPLSVYLADTAYTLLARLWRGKSLMTAHREHVYQRLVGATASSHVAIASFASGVAALVTLGWLFLPIPVACAVSVVLLGGYLASPALVRRVRAARDVADGDAAPNRGVQGRSQTS